MAKGKNVWVSPRPDGWAVQREGSDPTMKGREVENLAMG